MLSVFSVGAWASVAYAEPTTVALFVGSHQPGPGQSALRFAGADAERFRDVLVELGGLDPGDAELLTDPDDEALLAALDRQYERVAARAQTGLQTVFVFYYSGHARSQSLTLGSADLDLDLLRRRLEAMPSTLTLAFLDACQSGAISEVKGVEPAAAFSYQSAESLWSEGMAVMASSTGSELSQESAELQGSYFTHHLVTGLRGPADRDLDGIVSLDEAYAYAYDHTLITTAATRIGSQHATLETRLRGRGDMVLTRPTAADAWLQLDDPAQGRILVTRGDVVVAEVVKHDDNAFSLALPAGEYEVRTQDGRGPIQCRLTLNPGVEVALSTAVCVPIQVDVQALPKATGASRIKHDPGPEAVERLAVELGLGLFQGRRRAAYHSTLSTFGYRSSSRTRLGGILTLPVRLADAVAVAFAAGPLDRGTRSREWTQPNGEVDQFSWQAARLGAYPRAVASFTSRHTLQVFVQGGPGLTLANTKLTVGTSADETSPVRAHLAVGAGLMAMARRRRMDWGAFLLAEGMWAPTTRNAFDEVLDVGGMTMQVGVRLAP